MTKATRGIYAAAVSPFRADGSLDADRLIAYCRHLMTDGGCDGVAPTGTTGEGNSIAMVDRLALPEAFAAAGMPADRVIFGTPESVTDQLQELEEKLPLNYLLCAPLSPGSFDLFTEKVMPNFI